MKNKLTRCRRGHGLRPLSVPVPGCLRAHLSFLFCYKDSTPGAPPVLKPGLFVSLDTVAHTCFCFRLHGLACRFCLLLGDIPSYVCPAIYLINPFLDSLVKYVGNTACLAGPVLGAAVPSEQGSLCPPGANVLL